eukprot:9954571-Lingulodinium_polyedra.AAC.1
MPARAIPVPSKRESSTTGRGPPPPGLGFPQAWARTCSTSASAAPGANSTPSRRCCQAPMAFQFSIARRAISSPM